MWTFLLLRRFLKRLTFKIFPYFYFSYVVSVGVVDKLSQYFSSVRGPINDNAEAAEILQHGLGLLIAMAKLISKR